MPLPSSGPLLWQQVLPPLALLGVQAQGSCYLGCSPFKLEYNAYVSNGLNFTPAAKSGFPDINELANLVLLCDADHGLAHDHDLVMTRTNSRLLVTTPDGRHVWGTADAAFTTGLTGLTDQPDPSGRTSPAGPDAADTRPSTADPFTGVHPIDTAIGHAAREVGFFYIVGHGVPGALRQAVFDAAADLFTAPLAVREAASFAGAGSNRGYWLVRSVSAVTNAFLRDS